ncbi:MAG: protein translocase subunit SecD [Spirochaetales bacterium]|nr:protein translocase subunit SecD [Spirochaetales bacterium]
MSKRWRFILIIILLGIAYWFLYPTVKWYLWIPESKKEIATGSAEQVKLYAKGQANAALKDLLSMKLDDPLPSKYFFLTDKAKERYKIEKKRLPKTWHVEEVLSSYPGKAAVYDELESHYRDEVRRLKELRDRTLQLGLDLKGGMYVVIEADIAELEKEQGKPMTPDEKEDVMKRALEILNNRIDQFGVTEPQIRRQGANRIVVELPGAADRERMNKFILGKGKLDFHIVDDDGLKAFREYHDTHPNDFLDADGNLRDPGILPKGTDLLKVVQKDDYGILQTKGYTVVKSQPGLAGTYIRDAQVNRDPLTNQPVVNFFLTSEGGDIFYKLTSENVNKNLAVVLDNKVRAQARIAEPIRDAVRVTGFGATEAKDLALVLRTGALPVPLVIINSTAIGASLGEDAIRQGIQAIALGFLLVIFFMIIYYLGAGIIADIALILNLYFMVSILSVFNFTLTLTSIAGVILTVGMAVDANVIIYERIKEEYRIGKQRAAAIKAGFAKAFWTIMDANVTTFIAALALSQLGKGPVQGFAVTLAIGIVSSMFTALFVSRLIFDFNTETLHRKKLSISWRAMR